MFLQRFYDDFLAQASYLVGCQATGEALVIDPLREVEQYLDAARSEGLRVTHVTETHIHADFVSGSRELAARAGARLLLSNEGGPDWSYGFAADDGADLVGDGDHFMVGNIRLDVMHTPGHTPEHLTFVLTDTAGADQPMGAFTGDFVFVGDVGRPDLLEKAAGVEGTMRAGASDLFASLQRFRRLDDWIQIWPGHGAGSACGKGLGAVPSTTLGYEERFNWAFSHDSEDSFVAAVLEGQPDPPAYFARMKRINRDGPPILGGPANPPVIQGTPTELRAAMKQALAEATAGKAVVFDTRLEPAFGGGHIPGTLNVPLNRGFTTWAGWLLPYDRDLYLIAESAEAGQRAARRMSGIGLDRVAGVFPTEVLAAWASDGGAIQKIDTLAPDELADRMERNGVAVVDVRWDNEMSGGRIPGATHIPLGYLAQRTDQLPEGRPLVLNCAGGGRSAVASALLQAHGIADVMNLAGGFDQWRAEGRPIEHGESS
jgi:hydroxyacylglutathione hydrolase